MRLPPGRRLPLSPRGKKVLVDARKEVRRLGDDYLGTEHVLLGILGTQGGTAVRLLAGMGVSPEVVEERLYQFRRQAAG